MRSAAAKPHNVLTKQGRLVLRVHNASPESPCVHPDVYASGDELLRGLRNNCLNGLVIANLLPPTILLASLGDLLWFVSMGFAAPIFFDGLSELLSMTLPFSFVLGSLFPLALGQGHDSLAYRTSPRQLSPNAHRVECVRRVYSLARLWRNSAT